MSFSQLRISSDILKGLKDIKIETPSPLQKKIVNSMKKGADVLVTAPGDDGPETGYLVQVLDQIAKQDRRQGTKAVILTQKAERAAQLDKWIWAAGYHAGIESAAIEDEGDPVEQKSVLAAGPVVIVATPSRLAQLMQENRVIFREVQYLILDRAEEIDGWDHVDIIHKRVIGKCQHIAVAGEMNKDLELRLESFLNQPEKVSTRAAAGINKTSSKDGAPEEATKAVTENPASGPTDSNGLAEIPKDLTQYYIKVPPRMKISTLISHLEKTPGESILIFTASRRTADRLYRVLRKSGRRAVSVHGNLDKKTFQERFDRFDSGNVQHLVAGEIPASALAIKQVDQVINYDVPEEVGEYKMRAELVGDGKATRIVSLVSRQDRNDIGEIIDELGYAPEEIPLPGNVKPYKSAQHGKSDDSAGRAGAGHKKTNHSRGGSRDSRTRSAGKRTGQRRTATGRSTGGRGKRSRQPAETGKPVGLPRPSYDKLSGGRSGNKKEPGGLVGFFKKLFS